MADTDVGPATIDVLPDHRVRVEPFVPEIQERLLRRTLAFTAGGPLGHTVEPHLSDRFVEQGYVPRLHPGASTVDRVAVQRLPLGLLDEAVGVLERWGYAVTVHDRREDSPRWVRDPGWRARVPRPQHKAVAAVGEERALRVVASNLDAAADTITAAAAAYPPAVIAVGVQTHRQLRAIRRRLRPRMGREPLGLYTGKRKRPGRVSVGLLRQLPRGTRGDIDLLVLPFAAETVSDAALEVVTSGQYRRLLSFTPFRWSPDEGLNRRLLVVAGSVFPPPRPTVPVTAVVLDAHGTRPGAAFADPYDAKRQLYWQNARRNRRVAEVAKRLARGTKKATSSLGVADQGLLETVAAAARAGVAVLVETPVHARELAARLPGWAVWMGDDWTPARPAAGCGVIATELAADETVLAAGVLVRATGTRWPLPEVGWPWPGDVEHGVLIDFADAYHPAAEANAGDRVRGYQEAGMEVWEMSSADAAGGP